MHSINLHSYLVRGVVFKAKRLYAFCSFTLLIALIVVATKLTKPKSADSGVHTKATVQSCADGMSNPIKPPKSAGVFHDLTVEEIASVRDYLLMQAELNLTRLFTSYSKQQLHLSYTATASLKR